MAHQKFELSIDSRYDAADQAEIAREVIDFIVDRSRDGIDKDGNKFPAYSKEYRESLDFRIAGKSNSVNLTMSGEMLNSIELLSREAGRLTIGFQAGTQINDQAEGNILGTYGQTTPDSRKARDFLGISQSDLSGILARFPIEEAPRSPVDVEATPTLALSRLGINIENIQSIRERIVGGLTITGTGQIL